MKEKNAVGKIRIGTKKAKKKAKFILHLGSPLWKREKF